MGAGAAKGVKAKKGGEAWMLNQSNKDPAKVTAAKQALKGKLSKPMPKKTAQVPFVDRQSLGYVSPPPPPQQPKPICPPTLSFVLPSNLYVFPLTSAAATQLGLYSAVSGCIYYHSLQAQIGNTCMTSYTLLVLWCLVTACGLLTASRQPVARLSHTHLAQTEGL